MSLLWKKMNVIEKGEVCGKGTIKHVSIFCNVASM
jgi:hypothetical protein